MEKVDVKNELIKLFASVNWAKQCRKTIYRERPFRIAGHEILPSKNVPQNELEKVIGKEQMAMCVEKKQLKNFLDTRKTAEKTFRINSKSGSKSLVKKTTVQMWCLKQHPKRGWRKICKLRCSTKKGTKALPEAVPKKFWTATVTSFKSLVKSTLQSCCPK